MITFNSIEIISFKSIFNLKIDFSKLENTLYLLEGINNVESFSSSNGSGKSTIFDAISFAIFDTISYVSNKRSDYQNNKTKIPLEVILEFSVDSDDSCIVYKIDRKLQSVKLFVGSEDISSLTKSDTNKKIEDIIGIKKEEFFNFTYITQSTVKGNFLNKSVFEKFNSIKDIVFGKDLSEIDEDLKSLIRQYKSIINDIDIKISEVSGKLSEATNSYNNYSKIKESKILSNNEYADIVTRLKEIKSEKLKRDNLSIKISECKNKIEANVRDYNKIKENVNSIKRDRVCPYCNQEIKNTLDIKRKIENSISELKKSYESNKSHLEFLIDESKNINDSLIDSESDLLSKKIVQDELHSYNIDFVDSLKKNILDYNSKIDDLQKKRNSVTNQLEQLNSLYKYYKDIYIKSVEKSFLLDIENYLNLNCSESFNSSFRFEYSGSYMLEIIHIAIFLEESDNV